MHWAPNPRERLEDRTKVPVGVRTGLMGRDPSDQGKNWMPIVHDGNLCVQCNPSAHCQ